MSFLNKKHDVLDIQLTKHGRELLSKGIFKPYYYAFFDKDIVYDASTFGLTEAQNEIQDRILQETLTTQAQTSFLQTKVAEQQYTNIEISRINGCLGLPIGTSDGNVIYYPSWDIQVLNGNIKNFQLSQSAESNNNISAKNAINKTSGDYIPQINLDLTTFDVTIDKNFNVLSIDPTKNESRVDLPVKEDNSFLKQTNNSVILSIEEKNVIDIGENFDLEIFYVDHITNELQQLHFYKKARNFLNSLIKDDILLSDDEIIEADFAIGENTTTERPDIEEILNKDQKNTINYFEIAVDDEIDPNELKIKRLDIYDRTAFDANFNCPPET